ncbi:hypothetical protein SISNIDRAFT_498306 [Sistotremastrum niveocremeum HHB9708]|uniref:Uncharacterized protein n=2 Tax=Sistotremastraceae TaxID=3402574 RepID=A0A164NL78_9AGAM|nr:hypothetical protein SISNIDRAFT_498306 [Sistotremastrum niveocremeum HHB9708]KZT41950.1 hypothetical protein SISSUDRAFT_1117349 [Sistotremastrum suecicum HHB10207 ss-3]
MQFEVDIPQSVHLPLQIYPMSDTSDENQVTVPRHLLLFQKLGASLRDDPTSVIVQLSDWLSDPMSPRLWVPFAYSMRGLAYEELNNIKMAKHDYTAGMLAYEELSRDLGPKVASRMTNNVTFMEARKRALPEVPPTPKIEPRLGPMYVIIDDERPGRLW